MKRTLSEVGVVSRRQTVVLCDVCERDRPTRKVRIGWVGGKLRTLDLCDEHAAPVEKLLALVEKRRPGVRGIAAIPVVATPEAVPVAPPTRRTRPRRPETGLGDENRPSGSNDSVDATGQRLTGPFAREEVPWKTTGH